MKKHVIRNFTVDTAIDLFIIEVIQADCHVPFSTAEIVNWAKECYQCEVSPATVLYQLRWRAKTGMILETMVKNSRSEWIFYLIPAQSEGFSRKRRLIPLGEDGKG